MSFALFRSRRDWLAAPPSTGCNQRLYVMSDIHGERELFLALLQTVLEDDGLRAGPPSTLIILGDVIDRGPCSAQLLNALLAHSGLSNLRVLRGNHEDTLLQVVAGRSTAALNWFSFGGDATLRSFGVDTDAIDPDDGPAIIAATQAVVSQAIVDWLASLPLTLRIGDYFFTHAGIRPRIALKRQRKSDLLWIRDEFLESDADHGCVVVHGHSIFEDGPDLRANRIGIDTGAYRTGRLIALGLEGEARWTLEAKCPVLDQAESEAAG